MLKLIYWNLEIYDDTNLTISDFYKKYEYRNNLIINILKNINYDILFLFNINDINITNYIISYHINKNIYKYINYDNILVLYKTNSIICYKTIKKITKNNIIIEIKAMDDIYYFFLNNNNKILINEYYKIINKMMNHIHNKKTKNIINIGYYPDIDNIYIEFIKKNGFTVETLDKDMYTVKYTYFTDYKSKSIKAIHDYIWVKHINNYKLQYIYPNIENRLGYPDNNWPSSHIILSINIYPNN